jgi:hypothetical protein
MHWKVLYPHCLLQSSPQAESSHLRNNSFVCEELPASNPQLTPTTLQIHYNNLYSNARQNISIALKKRSENYKKKQAILVIATNKRVTSNKQTLNEYNTEIDDIYQRINLLKTRLEKQEQFSRRTNLRFHNIQIHIDRYGRI